LNLMNSWDIISETETNFRCVHDCVTELHNKAIKINCARREENPDYYRHTC
jgi:hypothetical protein